MIYLFTALYEEADLFIKKFSLKKNLENPRFQEFYHQDAGIRLTVTGVGEIAAASAVSSICTQYRPNERDLLFNIGTCAGIAGHNGVFLCHKIIEQATGKTFYPDLLYRHDLQEKTIVTGMLSCHRKGWQGIEMPPFSCKDHFTSDAFSGHKENSGGRLPGNVSATLYDMEAAAIYQAGAYFFGPHQMIFLKVVSDAGTPERVSREIVKRCMETHQEQFFDIIKRISSITQENGREKEDCQQEEKSFETLCEDLRCSKVMKDLLKQHIHYWKLAGSDYVSVIQDMYREGLLPCKEKREGKYCFEELKRRLF